MSVKKKISLENLFIFRECKKSLKETPIGFFYVMSIFYEPEKNQKKTQNFDSRFWEHDQSVEMDAQGPFLFFRSTEKSKNELPHRQNYLFMSLQDF